MLAVIFMVHNSTGITINNRGQLFLCHALTLSGFLYRKSYIVKVKLALVPFIFHAITT